MNDGTRRTNWIKIIVICPRRGMKQRVEQLYTVSVIVEALLYTHCNFKWILRLVDWLKLNIWAFIVCIMLCLFTLARLFKTLASLHRGQHFTSGIPLVVWIVWWFKWFLKGVWEGYFFGHARSSSGRAWNTANKQPRLRFHVRNTPCICRQQWSKWTKTK